MASIYEKWLARVQDGNVDLKALQRDLDALGNEVAKADAELQKQRSVLEKAKADHQALQELRNFFVHGAPTDKTERSVIRSRARRPGKRDLILGLLEGGQELHASAIRKILVDAEEMNADQASYHTLQVTLSQMFRANELERPARGVYRIAQASPDETLTHMAYET